MEENEKEYKNFVKINDFEWDFFSKEFPLLF
jgi:hypothetical protein